MSRDRSAVHSSIGYRLAQRVGLMLVIVVGLVTGWSVVHRGPNETSRELLPELQIRRANQTPLPATRADFDVRVVLTHDAVRELNVEIDGPCDIYLSGQREKFNRLPRGTVKMTTTRTEFKLGDQTYRASQIELVPVRSPGFWVNDHQYRGRLRLIRRPDQTFLAVNVLPLEEYLASVVDSEMPKAFPPAARQAQAVVARTFALYQIQQRRSDLFDVYASVQSQKYLGFQYRDGQRRLAGESEESRQIVEQTRGMVCLDRGRLFRTYYSAVCGGSTTSGREVFPDTPTWLTGVSCNWCSAADRYRWSAEFERKDFFQRTASLLESNRANTGIADRRVSNIESIPLKQLGLIPTFFLTNQGKRAVVSGIDLRNQLGTSKLY
ncbi:MAG: SpoIID/LytB domain-containing protein, partial [Planctomycetota bacterium]|nr:SpoIID/LytB domain-containing protein [Planctomycetota bacterium]